MSARISIRASNYDGRRGFLVSGTDGRGRRAKVLADTRTAAEHIKRKLIKGDDINTADFAHNPPLVIFANPPRGGYLGDVKAIVYSHASTRELMVHGFGPQGEDIRLEDLRDGVAIRKLPRGKTDARAIANGDGSITLRNARGLPLWADL